jgi:hypothetical protein
MEFLAANSKERGAKSARGFGGFIAVGCAVETDIMGQEFGWTISIDGCTFQKVNTAEPQRPESRPIKIVLSGLICLGLS